MCASFICVMYKVQFMVICISLLWKLLLHTATTEIKYSWKKNNQNNLIREVNFQFNNLDNSQHYFW